MDASAALAEAKENVRALKERMASQTEVRAAVEKYVSLKYGTPLPEPEPERKWEEIQPVEVAVGSSPSAPTTVEEAAERIRVLKADRASPSEVQAAVDQYTALKNAAEPTTEEPAAPASELSLPTTLAEAAELVRSLKAKLAAQADVRVAVDHYLALSRAATLSAAGDRVRQAKESNASQEEVDAAVAAYNALTQPPVSVPPPSSSVSSSVSSSSLPKVTTVEEAAERIRTLKANSASQEEVRAAIAAFVALRDKDNTNTPVTPREPSRTIATQAQAETKEAAPQKPAEVAVKSPEVDAAEQKVKDLKAQMAPQDEVREAVEAYVALKFPSRPRPQPIERKVEHNQSPLEAAVARVRALKAAQAPQAEVTAAVEEYRRLKAAPDMPTEGTSPLDAAIMKVRALKDARASQEEVSAAVAEYKALRAAAGAEVKAQPTESPKAAASEPQQGTEEVEQTEEPAVRVHMPTPSE